MKPSYVSPRKRAQRTLELLEIGCKEKLPWEERRQHKDEDIRTNAKVQITEDIREWDYGDYEGVTSADIKVQREKEGKGPWDIWRDGCPGGEYVFFHSHITPQKGLWSSLKEREKADYNRSPEDVTRRIDRLIDEIRSKYHTPVIGKPKGSAGPGDVLLVAHGHILRAFAMRWVQKTLRDGPTFLLEAGGVGTLSYEHHSINEPAILLGGSFMVDVVEASEAKGEKLGEKKASYEGRS